MPCVKWERHLSVVTVRVLLITPMAQEIHKTQRIVSCSPCELHAIKEVHVGIKCRIPEFALVSKVIKQAVGKTVTDDGMVMTARYGVVCVRANGRVRYGLENVGY